MHQGFRIAGRAGQAGDVKRLVGEDAAFLLGRGSGGEGGTDGLVGRRVFYGAMVNACVLER